MSGYSFPDNAPCLSCGAPYQECDDYLHPTVFCCENCDHSPDEGVRP